MLYDTTADVIRKALRGLNLASSAAANRCDLPEREVIAASRGPVTRETLIRLAPALGLDPEALASLASYTPKVHPLDSIFRFELPFHDETVNAWLLDGGDGTKLLFDTGDGPGDLRQVLDRRGIGQVEVIITHGHADHTGGLAGLQEILHSLAGPDEGEILHPGDSIRRGNLDIRAIGLPGHCPGALGYLVSGLERPVCVTGDALFAGSIGGCAPGTPYRQALAALHAEVMSLPGETVLLPGHGPATTVDNERKANPFLAGCGGGNNGPE
jgi:hydroxyacylglutathione hydrolase